MNHSRTQTYHLMMMMMIKGGKFFLLNKQLSASKVGFWSMAFVT
jgi:hypothetical protein